MTSLAMGTYPVNHSLQDLSHRFHLNIPGGCVQEGRFAQELGAVDIHPFQGIPDDYRVADILKQ